MCFLSTYKEPCGVKKAPLSPKLSYSVARPASLPLSIARHIIPVEHEVALEPNRQGSIVNLAAIGGLGRYPERGVTESASNSLLFAHEEFESGAEGFWL